MLFLPPDCVVGKPVLALGPVGMRSSVTADLVPSSVSTSWPWPEGCPGSHAVGEGKPEATEEHPGFLNAQLWPRPPAGCLVHMPPGAKRICGSPQGPAISPEPSGGRAGCGPPALLMRGGPPWRVPVCPCSLAELLVSWACPALPLPFPLPEPCPQDCSGAATANTTCFLLRVPRCLGGNCRQFPGGSGAEARTGLMCDPPAGSGPRGKSGRKRRCCSWAELAYLRHRPLTYLPRPREEPPWLRSPLPSPCPQEAGAELLQLQL